ncbi:hypothetical protein RHGRI_025250 [Rhododendron griersonianum]|uniref:Cation-transporting P-type ATPase N-terminal domain-containing protein n=1 Tax=Rhododendron griersonianum TaxID=479676 RepID=A0AAV6JE32_9ERIC|nr:hypothetical protein RHGRI_025250 [Rhododendron griersonianum]
MMDGLASWWTQTMKVLEREEVRRRRRVTERRGEKVAGDIDIEMTSGNAFVNASPVAAPAAAGNDHEHDVEAGGVAGLAPQEVEFVDPFDIANTKNASIESLKRWRQAALVLNASRRFRYTLDLGKEEETEQRRRMIRAHAQVIRAALLFKLAGQRAIVLGSTVAPPTPCGDYEIALEELASMTRDQNNSALQEYGGAKGVADLLKTNLDTGITGDDSELANRRNAFGSNTYPVKKGRTFLRFLWEAWQDLTLIILMIAAIASLALGIKTEGLEEGWYDGGSIAFAVLLVIVVTATSDYRQSLQFQNLNEEKRNIHLEVVRGGRREKISIYDIVVGDVIPLKIGDQVPADGILISGHSLAIDESSMTGESKIVRKDQKGPFLMSGCKVADGSATILVTAVGINTEWGLLMASISEDNGEETPLQVRLNGVATFVGIVGLSVALFVLAVLFARYFSGHSKNADGTVQFVRGKTSLGDAVDGAVKIITIAVTIVVVAVPEGLPLAVTLTLAYSMRKMMADKALAFEAYVGRKKITSPEDNSQFSVVVSSLLHEGIAQNTSGSVFPSKGGGDIEVSGSPTEKAILHWGIKLGMNFDVIRSESTVLKVSPFNSEKKRGGLALKRPNSEVLVHWKGAAELVLASCAGYLDSNGSRQSIENDKMFFKEAIDDMAARSLRCVAIAYRSHEMDKVPTDEEQLSQWNVPDDDLVLLAIVGIKDPCRPGVKDAVRVCTNAGVKVRMVTGDNIQTAKAIAMECGILASDADVGEHHVIEGKTFRELSEKERELVAPKISVMGRSSPNDKLLLVQALRKGGEVVAVTGDGTNDAPALHEADIGLSMGISGTEVAKESSDIIILDDNFASVVKVSDTQCNVVRWGRSVYANIQKFIQFQLTVNVAALVINVVAAISAGDVPLNAVQLLWVNLIMDTLGALALATEPPTDHLMKRSPVGRRSDTKPDTGRLPGLVRSVGDFWEPLITNIMWRNLIVQALYQVTVLLVLNFFGKGILNLDHDSQEHANKLKNTLVFNAFVFCQIFNEFNARKPDQMNVFSGITKNRLFVGIVGATFVLQVRGLVYLSLSSLATSSQRLDSTGVSGLFPSLLESSGRFLNCWPLAMVGKLIPVPKTPFAKIFIKPYQRCIAARSA